MPTCDFCSCEYPDTEPFCIACGHPGPYGDGTYPNVILASSASEADALNSRYSLRYTGSESFQDIVDSFENAVRSSKAVMARKYEPFKSYFSDLTDTHKTYWQLLDPKKLWDEKPEIDRKRELAEKATLPDCYPEIRFAALSIDGIGVPFYGTYFLVANDKMVENRTSVFEDNCVFWREREGIDIDAAAPCGFRAVWENRHMLALAKLHAKITSATTTSDFPRLLLTWDTSGTGTDGCGEGDNDYFVETHIWGTVSPQTFEKVIALYFSNKPGEYPKRRRILDRDIKEIVDAWGHASFEVRNMLKDSAGPVSG